jgi:3-phenylpropionate/trans-cinnamate dioxygenase ferredoxin reductase subunit
MTDGIVIAGGGLAAQRACETLRRQGHTGTLRIICAEQHLPYDRPPLSKGVLSGEHGDDSVQFRPREWYADNEVDLLLGVSATGLSTRDRRVDLSDGTTLRYEKLLIATGSRPRALALLAPYENVSELRTIDDAQRLRRALGPGVRLAVVGAGFIGMEVASTARKLGAEVTMIEAAPCPLVGILGEQLGTWFAELHRSEGVEVITDRTVVGVDVGGGVGHRVGGIGIGVDVGGVGVGGAVVRSLVLSDDRVIETDHVVVGVGVQPEVQWLAGSGLANGGVAVDVHGQTEADGVFAAGDAAATFDERVGRHVAGSHWEAAGRQAVRAARVMLGLEPGNVELSSFWTDQYGIRIQYLGSARLADAMTIDGEPDHRNFSVTFTHRAKPVAALLVDRTRSLPAMRKLISGEGTT